MTHPQVLSQISNKIVRGSIGQLAVEIKGDDNIHPQVAKPPGFFIWRGQVYRMGIGPQDNRRVWKKCNHDCPRTSSLRLVDQPSQEHLMAAMDPIKRSNSDPVITRLDLFE
jgi:hypothetical protein